MRRGEVWTVAGGAAYAGTPRPAVIIQDDRFDANDSIVVCPLTTDPTSAQSPLSTASDSVRVTAASSHDPDGR